MPATRACVKSQTTCAMPTAKRLLADHQPYIRDLDLVVLAKCAAAFGVPAHDPWRLLEYRED